MDENRTRIKTAVDAVRRAFQAGDWAETVELYRESVPFLKNEKALRLEATCLAARALTSQRDRAGARTLLKGVAGGTYKKAVHYEFLAHAFLDLKQYEDAARFCEKAADVRRQEQAK